VWPEQRWLTALTLAIAWAIGGAVWMDRRAGVAARAEALRYGLEPRPSVASLPADAEGFLATLDRSLDLPANVRSEIHDELSCHLEDSIAALQAEGLESDRATREALARLGRPEELARQIRKAHQTTRRLLAGAGGGVFSAGVGVVQGYILGIVIFLTAAIAMVVLVGPAINLVTSKLLNVQLAVPNIASPSVFGAVLAWVPAFIAGRRAVQASAQASQRTVRQVGRWWAVAGVLAIGYVLMFQLTVQEDWLVVAAELAIPIAFAAGALLKTEAHVPRVGGWTRMALLSLVLVVPVLGLSGGMSVQGGQSGIWQSSGRESLAYDRVAPAWPEALVIQDGAEIDRPIIDLSWHAEDPALVARFRDLRFEAWRAVKFAEAPDWVGLFVPDTRYSAPFATEPAATDNGAMQSRFDMSHVRTSQWLIFLTGVGPNGVRYRLSYNNPSVTTTFSGTVWDWLTAAE
jgi:uncharacterized membrane protein